MMRNWACMSLSLFRIMTVSTALTDERRPAQKMQTVTRGLALRNLPWDDLKTNLDTHTVLLDDIAPSAYVEECLPIVEYGFSVPGPWGPHYLLNNQTSGICMMNVLCGLKGCGFDINDKDNNVDNKMTAIITSALQGNFSMFDSSNNPRYNLPSVVVLPQVAKDVAAAINFAKKHSIEVSIKNSGHSYTGSSTKKETLHLHMRSYNKYSSNGVVECSYQQNTVMEQDLSNQPCKAALARSKSAYIHVGGGENWDEVYQSVKAFNEQQDNYKYHVVGGAAGSVSPMGWTWQGGLSGTTAGRLYGFGADQVLQIEMILPSGLHVRFGPVEWEDAEGFVYPRTKKVSGVCNQNHTVEDSSIESWGPCEDNTNFNDLWFATLGGLGGSWGVVLSIQLQLHEYDPLEFVSGTACEQAFTNPTAKAIFFRFLIDFYLDPTKVGLSEDESNRCGAPTAIFDSWCYGNGAGDAFVNAWKTYITERNQTLHEDGGYSYENINAYADCRQKEFHKDYVDWVVIKEGDFAGRAKDDGISVVGTYPIQNIIVPKKWILENKDKAVSFMSGSYDAMKAQSIYLAFGGFSTSDQANSLSDAHRKGGFMIMNLLNIDPVAAAALGFTITIDVDTFYKSLPDMYEWTDSNRNTFHGYYGSNHAGPVSLGPLKSDWTKPCPLGFSEKEREDKCVPLQLAIFGTERLARLETIKEAIDPNYMFDCYRCIGNNRIVSMTSTPTESPTINEPTHLTKSPTDSQAPTNNDTDTTSMPTESPTINEPTHLTTSPTNSQAPTDNDTDTNGGSEMLKFDGIAMMLIAATYTLFF